MKMAEGKDMKLEANACGFYQFLPFRFPVLFVLCWCLCGCSVDQYFQPQELSYEKLAASYYQTRLKASSTLDVLGSLRKPEYESATHLLSQSDTALASLGQSEKGYKTWFTMVTFDEHNLTAQRKYFYLVDERAKMSLTRFERYFIPPSRGLIFDCQVLPQADVLDRPYITEEARQIAILKQVAENLRKDIDELGEVTDELSQGNQMLAVSGMLMNQVFEAILLELDKSPILAKGLSDKSGVEFNHMSFDKGGIRMAVDGGIVTLNIRLGLFRRTFEAQENQG